MQFQSFVYSSWPGGRNSVGLPASIREDQMREILNQEYDSEDKLTTRLGVAIKSVNGDPDDITSRITSMYQFRKSDATTSAYVTSGTEVYRFDLATGGLDDINTLTLPNDTLWDWVTFPVKNSDAAGDTDAAIGVNRGTDSSTPNPVYITDHTADPATLQLSALGGFPATAAEGPVDCSFMTIWNNRVFLAGSTSNPTRLYFSRVGNGAWYKPTSNSPEISAGFQDVGSKDGEAITGLITHRQRLYIFKRNKCYMVIPGTPNTDLTLWKYEEISPSIGSVGHFTIKSALNDVLFLSDYGLMSLAAVQTYGDVDASLLSRDIKELRDFNRSVDSFYAYVFPQASQYCIAIPKGLGGTENQQVHVFDFKRGITPDRTRWSMFEGLIAGATYGKMRESGVDRLYIGSYNGGIYRQKQIDETNPYNDSGAAYTKQLQFRDASPIGNNLSDLRFSKWGLALKNLTNNPVHMSVGIKFDGNDAKASSTSYVFAREEHGSIWADDDMVLDSNELGSEGTFRDDDGTGGTGLFATEAPGDLDLVERFGKPEGNRGETVQFTLTCTAADEAFALKSLMMSAAPTQDRYVGDV